MEKKNLKKVGFFFQKSYLYTNILIVIGTFYTFIEKSLFINLTKIQKNNGHFDKNPIRNYGVHEVRKI